MELDEARNLLRSCQKDRQEAQETLKTAKATVESSKLIIQGILKLFPELADEEKEWGDWEIEDFGAPSWGRCRDVGAPSR